MRKFGVAVGLALVVASGSWMLAAPVVGPVAIAPSTAVVGVPAAVTVTALIQDPLLIPASVNLQQIDATGKVVAIVGTLLDDGTNGDVVAGDKTFTIRWSVQPTAIGQLRYQVSAGFKGLLRRVASAPATLVVTEPPPPPVVVTLDEACGVAARVTPVAGGVLETECAGNRFTLEIPPHALVSAETISLTPAAEVQNLPTGVGTPILAQFGPTGLRFLKPVTLTIVSGSPLPEHVAGYSFQDDGSGFYFHPVELDGSTLRFQVLHFTPYGASPTDCVLNDGHPLSADDWAKNRIAVQIEAFHCGTISAYTATRFISEAFDDWYLRHRQGPVCRSRQSRSGFAHGPQ